MMKLILIVVTLLASMQEHAGLVLRGAGAATFRQQLRKTAGGLVYMAPPNPQPDQPQQPPKREQPLGVPTVGIGKDQVCCCNNISDCSYYTNNCPLTSLRSMT